MRSRKRIIAYGMNFYSWNFRWSNTSQRKDKNLQIISNVNNSVNCVNAEQYHRSRSSLYVSSWNIREFHNEFPDDISCFCDVCAFRIFFPLIWLVENEVITALTTTYIRVMYAYCIWVAKTRRTRWATSFYPWIFPWKPYGLQPLFLFFLAIKSDLCIIK